MKCRGLLCSLALLLPFTPPQPAQAAEPCELKRAASLDAKVEAGVLMIEIEI